MFFLADQKNFRCPSHVKFTFLEAQVEKLDLIPKKFNQNLLQKWFDSIKYLLHK